MNSQKNDLTLGLHQNSDGKQMDGLELHTIFETETNPYEFFITSLSKMDYLSLDEGKDSADTRLITAFKNFLDLNDNKVKYLPLLTTAIQFGAFGIIKKLKNEVVQKVLIDIYSLKDAKCVLKSQLINDLKINNMKGPTIVLIKLLELSSNFNVRELLVPLLLEDKLSDVDEILENNEIHRWSFIQLLDEVVGNKIYIPGLNNKKFVFGEKTKGIFHIGIKLMKKFSIPSTLCPNMIYFQKRGRLRYMFINYYKEKKITLQSFLLFVKDLAINDDSLKKEALQLFAKNRDHRSAEWLKSAIQRSGGSTLCFEDTIPQRNQVFYKLNLPAKDVRVIDSSSEFDDAVKYLKTFNVIAYDTEWKPVRLYDEVVKLSLIQMALKDRVYIFDMMKLPDVLSDNQWNNFGELFSSEHILKLTYSYTLEEEKEKFRGTSKCLEEHIMKMENVTDLRTVEDELKESHHNIFTYKTEDLKGLCGLVYMCFGKPLDKIQQCSYWTLRPLSHGQLNYAALDAFCLIEIFNYLNLKSKQMKIECKYLQVDMV